MLQLVNHLQRKWVVTRGDSTDLTLLIPKSANRVDKGYHRIDKGYHRVDKGYHRVDKGYHRVDKGYQIVHKGSHFCVFPTWIMKNVSVFLFSLGDSRWEHYLQRPVFNFSPRSEMWTLRAKLAPRGKLAPLEWTLSPRGEVIHCGGSTPSVCPIVFLN
jgi:hypothetical protein